jgi:hypothetical protein
MTPEPLTKSNSTIGAFRSLRSVASHYRSAALQTCSGSITKYSRRIYYECRWRCGVAGTAHESIQQSMRFVHYDFVRFDFVALRRRPAAATSRNTHAEFIANVISLSALRRINHSMDSAMMLHLFEGESNMIKKLLGAAAMAAVVFAVAPASAAKMVGCSGDNLEKVETAVEALPDGQTKYMGFKEITAAQAALLDGHMAQCGEHLNRAAHAGMMK